MIATVIDGSEPAADGVPLAPGVHLRWSIDPQLAYPTRGFLIERYIERGEIPVGRWETLATVKSPTAAVGGSRDLAARAKTEFRQRVYGSLAGAFAPDDERLADIVDFTLPHWPLNEIFTGAQQGSRPGIKARRLDLLNLALLDPKAALGLGFYFIDSTLPPGVQATYRVTGLWRTTSWRWVARQMSSLHARDVRSGRVNLGGLQLHSDRLLDLVPSGGAHRYLRLTGSAWLPLQFELPEAASEFSVVVSSTDASPFTVVALRSDGTVVTDARITRSSRSVRVTSPRRDIHAVELRQPSSGDATWTIRWVGYRAFSGAIGDRYAEAEVAIEPSTLPQLRVLSARPTEAASPEDLRPNAPRASEAVELTLGNNTGESAAPLFHVQRWSASDRAYAPLTEGVQLGPVPKLIHKSQLDGSESAIRLRAGAGPATHLFSHQRPVLSTQVGYAQTYISPLDRLGQGLMLSIWVLAGTQAEYRTILDHNWQRSFWLGLTPHPGRLRFWLNGQRFESSARPAPNIWFHVAVLYDGQTVRLYLNGRLDSTHAAALGPVQRGSGRWLNIGGTPPTSGAATSMPLRGFVSSLRVYQLQVPPPDKTDLLGHWPFISNARSRPPGLDALPEGRPRFVAGHPEHASYRVPELDGSSWYRVPGLRGLSDMDTELCFQAWIRPEPGQSWPSIFGNNFSTSVWLGLRPGDYRLRFRINGGIFESRSGVPAGSWSHVAVVYDGYRVRFLINGRPDSEHVALLGPVVASPGRDFTIGSDNGAYPFRGRLADIRLTASAPESARPYLASANALVGWWPLNGELDDEAKAQPTVGSNKPDLVDDHPLQIEGTCLRLDGRQHLQIRRPHALAKIGDRLTVEAWIRAESASNTPAIVGYDWQQGFWLGIAPDRRLRFYFNRRRYQSRSRISLNSWTRVAVSYDGEQVKFFIQRNEPDITRGARLGALTHGGQALAIGADAPQAASRAGYRFQGWLSDVRIWADALTPHEADEQLARGRPPSGDFLDRGLVPDRYRYRTAAVDLVGRRGPLSPGVTLALADTTPPPPPIGVRCRFMPLSGAILAVEDRDPTDPLLRLRTDILLEGVRPADRPVIPETAARAAESMKRYDVVVDGSRDGDARQETLLIRAASFGPDGRLLLDVESPALARLDPRVGDRVKIEFDTHFEVRWAWSGWHQLSAPDVKAFRLYHREGAADAVEALVESADQNGERFTVTARLQRRPAAGRPGDWVGRFCRVAAHRYRIESASLAGTTLTTELRYLARPIVKPKPGDPLVFAVPVDPGTRDTAANWLGPRAIVPADGLGPAQEFDELTLAAVSDADYDALAAEAPGRSVAREGLLTCHLPASAGTVSPDEPPGALVAFSFGRDNYGWRAFRVKAQRTVSGGRTLLYLTDDTFKGDPAAPFDIRRVRYLRGVWRTQVLAVTPGLSSEVATRAWQVAITAADHAATADHRGESGVTGNEGGLSRMAQAIAVNRQRPERPEPPRVSIDAADYFGEARARVSWDHLSLDAASVEVHRATDSAVFSHDMTQRRKRRGAYSVERYPDPTAMMADDDDFLPWLRARFPELAPTWTTALFVPKSSAAAYRAASEVWQAWAERYYPTLSDRDLQGLAELPGNEAAFGLVTSPPIRGSEYLDPIRGLASNRFLYRLKAMNPAHLGSTGPGAVSAPVQTVQVLPPRTPVFASVTAGDRTITLDWPLVRQANVSRYRLYRSETAADLDDLRHFGAGDDARLVATIDDPLLRSWGGEVRLPDGPDVAALLGVYRLDEFDMSRAGDAQAAFNYVLPTSTHSGGILGGLRPLADGLPVVAVWRDSGGALRSMWRSGDAPPYTDSRLQGSRDYFYRLLSVDRRGNASRPSLVARARPLDTSLPEALPLSGSWGVGVARLGWRADWETLLQRRGGNGGAWATLTPWLEAGDHSFDDPDATTDRSWHYRLWARNAGGQTSIGEPVILDRPEA